MPDANRIATAGGLVEALSKLPPQTRVLVDGYEGDFDDAEVVLFQVQHHPEAPWWSGTWVGEPGGELSVVLRRVNRRT